MNGAYRRKSEAQLAWNKIKRAAFAQAAFEAANYREERINDILSEAWPKFEASLGQGELLELEAGFDVTDDQA